MRKKFFKALLLSVVWLPIVFLLSLMVQIGLLGDECQYHSGDTSFLFNLFYKFTSSNGYHPSPTILNLIVTVFVPAFLLGRATAKPHRRHT